MCAKYVGLCIFIAIIHKEFIALENWGEIVSERGDYEDLLPKFAVYKYG